MTTLILSYARGDDEPFVRRLNDDLVQHGPEVWWDRVSMPNRTLTFLHEIRDAIAGHYRLPLVLAPKALLPITSAPSGAWPRSRVREPTWSLTQSVHQGFELFQSTDIRCQVLHLQNRGQWIAAAVRRGHCCRRL